MTLIRARQNLIIPLKASLPKTNIRAKENKTVHLTGRFDLPVIISTTLPDGSQAIVVEFGTPFENFDLPPTFNYYTSNGGFQGDLIWQQGDYQETQEGICNILASLVLIPIFKNRPSTTHYQSVIVKTFRASNILIKASNNEIEV